MIAVGSAIRMLGGGLHFYGFTVFFLPLSKDLGLNRAATSLIFSLARAEGAIEGPIVGYLIDRLGPRVIMLTAVAMSGLGYMLLSTVDQYFTFLLVYLGIISLSFGAGIMHCPMVLANNWFIRQRGLAMAVISASVGLGGAVLTPLLAMGVHAWGWRPATLTAGLVFMAIGLPLSSMVRRSPESMNLLPDGDPPRGTAGGERLQENAAVADSGEKDIALRVAMRTSAFWIIALTTFIRITGLSSVIVHFIPIMVWKGIPEPRAAFLLAVFAFFSVVTHIVLGMLADRVNKPRLMALIMLVGTGSLLLLIYAEEEWMLWLFLPLLMVVEALFPVTWATVGDIFGRKHFATIRGTMSFFYMWGGVIAPIAAGAIYDRSQTYTPMLWVLVILYLGGAVLYLFLNEPWNRARAKRVLGP